MSQSTKMIAISEVARIVTGKTPSTKEPLLWNGDTPFVTPGDLQFLKSIINTGRTVSDTACVKMAKQLLPARTICVSCIGNLGYVGMTTKRSLSNQQINSLIPNNEKDAEYLYYTMKNLWQFFKKLEGQSTTLSILNKSQFSRICIPWPDEITRRQIGQTLSLIDSKIELNTQLNGYLDELSAAVFENWLTKHAGGKEVASLTTDDGRLSLGELCSKVTDGSHSSPRNNPNGKYPMLSVRDMRRFGFDYTSCKMINRLDFDTMVSSDCVPKVDDILVAKDGSYLKEIFITNEERHEAVLSSIAIFRPDKRVIAPEILLRFLKHPRIQKLVADNFVSGSALPRIVLKDFKKLALLTPSRKEQAEILPILQMIRSLTWANEVENERLTNLRDVLLPKLIAGEIDVSKVHFAQLNDDRRIH